MKNNNAKASLIIGIISCAFGAIECYLFTVVVGLILGLVAIGLGISSIKSNNKKYAFSGMVLGITGILIACIWLHMIIVA